MTAKRKPNKGSFKPGNPGGPGRPRREVEEDYLKRLHAKLTPAMWDKIVEKAIADAIAGDPTARSWLSRYVLPRDVGDNFEALLRAIA